MTGDSAYVSHPDPATEEARADLFADWSAQLQRSLIARVAWRRELTAAAGLTEAEYLATPMDEREEILHRGRRALGRIARSDHRV